MGGINEHTVADHSFEIVFAFDEIIAPMGYAESGITSDQVASFLEMYSQEENLHDLIQQSREEDAIQQGKLKAASFAKKKAEGTAYTGGFGSSYSSAKSRSRGGYTFTSADSSGSEASSPHIGTFRGSSASDRYAGVGIGSSSSSSLSSPSGGGGGGSATSQQIRKPKSISIKSKAGPKRAGGAGKELLNDLIKSGDVQITSSGSALDKNDERDSLSRSGSNFAAIQPNVPNMEGVHFKIEETVMAELNREGGLSKLDIKGEMHLTISDAESASIRVNLSDSFDTEGFQSKTHPNIDKKVFSSANTLALKNPKRPFPLKTALKVLTWKLKSGSEDYLPLTVSCWPSPTQTGMSITVEYDLKSDTELSGVVISIPVPDTNAVNVEPLETGTFKMNHQEGELQWILTTIDPSNNPNGSLEFAITGTNDDNQFFPINVQFVSQQPVSQIAIDSVESVNSENQAISFSTESHVTSSKFIVT